MTAPRTPASGSAPAAGPVPRRVRPPRWLDLRLVLGVLLVLGSVLLGARVVTEADSTVPVWAVTGDLAAGTVLAGDDLVAVDVRLDRAAGAYLAASTRPAGRILARAVRAGELLPRSVLEEPPTLVQLALPVQAGYVPPSLQRGQVVDVYAVDGPVQGGPRTGEVSLVVAAAPVQAVSGRTDGVLATATTTVQVVVSVTADRAAAVLGAIAGRPLVVVVHESVDVDGGPSTAPPSPPRPSTAGPASPGAGAGAGSATPPGAVAPPGPPQAAVPPAVPFAEPQAAPPAAPSPVPGVAAVPVEPVPPAPAALPAP